MDNKVYVLTAGIYSDYHIIGCFSDLEKAEKAKLILGGKGKDIWIKEYKLNEFFQNKTFLFDFEYRKQGALSVFAREDQTKMISIPENEKCKIDNCGDYFFGTVEASDIFKAKKIASDMIAKYKAEKLGL